MADREELLRLTARVQELTAENQTLSRALAQSKKARVYALPGGSQLLRWVQRCTKYDYWISEDVEGFKVKQSTRRANLAYALEHAEVRLAQLGGDPNVFQMVVELRSAGRTVTYTLDEDNCDNRFEWGNEVTEKLPPFQLRFMMGHGDAVQFQLSGIGSGRYAWAEYRENSFNDMLINCAKEEFRVGAAQVLCIALAHSLEFLPLATRRAYLEYLRTAEEPTFMHQCLNMCTCFQPDGKLKPKKLRDAK